MQITIDTNKDSHEDIKKAIKLLASMVGQENVLSNEQPRNIFDTPSSPEPSSSGSVFGSLFDSIPIKPENEEQKKPEPKQEIIEFY